MSHVGNTDLHGNNCILVPCEDGGNGRLGQNARCRYLRGKKRGDNYLEKAFSSQGVCFSTQTGNKRRKGKDRKGKDSLFSLPTSACLSPLPSYSELFITLIQISPRQIYLGLFSPLRWLLSALQWVTMAVSITDKDGISCPSLEKEERARLIWKNINQKKKPSPPPTGQTVLEPPAHSCSA